MSIPALIASTVLAANASPLGLEESPKVSITIYSSADPAGFDPQRYVAQQRNGFDPTAAWQVPGFGVVKQLRTFTLEPGRNSVSFTDVAAFLDPTTVGFTDLTDADTSILEQSFQFDLVSPSKLLEKYLDRPIKAIVPSGDRDRVVEGVLLSANQGRLVVRTDAGLEIVDGSSAQISLQELPEGFLTRPTLVWDLLTAKGGEHEIRTTYQTAGLTWRADYNLVLNGDDTEADLTAWVTLLNLSGITYPDARLKLVAGDVQRVQPRTSPIGGGMRRAETSVRDQAFGKGFEEQSFFEYHLYTLPRTTTIANNASQQLSLFPTVQNASISKELVYQPTGPIRFGSEPYTNRDFVPYGANDIGVFISFKNTEENRLGMPLPKGRIRAYKQDPRDGTLEFIGEDMIDHTPRNETVRIKLGDAFDVVGERKRMDFSVDKKAKRMSETIEIEIRNQKKTIATVVVRENLYRWKNWKIAERNLPFKKINSNTVEWELEIAPEATSRIRYKVDYSW